MNFLVDVNVLSEPTKRVCSQAVVNWLEEHADEIVADPVVMGEIWRGVDALPEGRKKIELIAWFGTVRASIRCRDWTIEASVMWAEMVNRIKRAGHTVGLMDTMIAATAKLHGLTVATRNVDDFRRCGVAVVNPFEP